MNDEDLPKIYFKGFRDSNVRQKFTNNCFLNFLSSSILCLNQVFTALFISASE